ncbi:MAG: hypothetical protein IMZ53_01750 [Thermoplasmata archaeon]|nr:hypothetical protein [Thermoplasmata archaeon]
MQNIGFDLSSVGGSFLRRTWMLQRTFNWQLIMPFDFKGNIGFLVSQYCQDVNFGDYSITTVSSMRYGAYQRFYAGLQDISTVTLTFLVPVDNSVYDYFYSWSNLIVDAQGHYSPKNVYKKTIFVMMYDRTGIQATKFALKGTFPLNKVAAGLSYGTEGIVTLTMTLSVDTIEPSSFLGDIRSAVTGVVQGVAKGVTGALGF